jgi:hypothetical protein
MKNETTLNHCTPPDAKHLLADSASLSEAQIEHQIEMDEEEDSYWMDDDDYEEEIIGYECLACGHLHNEKPMDGCDKCLSYSVDAMYG